ncbi:MAG: 2-oxo acid dehydrogenase subunit E2 [Pseudomonadota bacterium]|nr:2-oxo acid dehydrogenase subunit E2 [Pseudomonadota bacterium]QKK05689.1 MAG: 2-oxo acid dehydrogenase subunit E2 [Pseudomonadota bacterium]
MGKYVFILPDLGEGIVSTEIAEVQANVGDIIQEDDQLMNVLTDKAVMELPSPVTGKVVYLAGKKGDVVAVGTPIAVFEVEDSLANIPDDQSLEDILRKDTANSDTPQEGAPKVQPEAAPKKEVKTKTPQMQQAVAQPVSESVSAPPEVDNTVLTSPYLRRIAYEQGVDLTQIKGTGPSGRITQEDYDRFAAAGAPRSSRGQKKNGVKEIPVIGMRRIIARRMQESKQNIPHITYVEEVDVTGIEDLRHSMNNTREEGQPRLTILPFLMLALVKACAKYPKCNSTFDDAAEIVYQHNPVHIGIAAMTAQGLMVPVVKHSEALDIWGVAAEMQRLSEAAKSGTAARDELIGSTITITSLGPLGGLISTPIINAPEVAIVGVNKIVERPMVVDGNIAVRKMMNLSSSFDHRIIDGYDAAEFVNYIKLLLENPAMIFV